MIYVFSIVVLLFIFYIANQSKNYYKNLLNYILCLAITLLLLGLLEDTCGNRSVCKVKSTNTEVRK